MNLLSSIKFSRRMLRDVVTPGMIFFLMVAVPSWSNAQSLNAAKEINQVIAISVDSTDDNSIAHIVTRDPVGYRYTVYDSHDPSRVVIDFPGMDVSSVASQIKVDSGTIQEVRVSSFDLASGRLGRIELLLAAKMDYNVSLSGNDFRVTFANPSPLPGVTATSVAPSAEPVMKAEKTAVPVAVDTVSVSQPQPEQRQVMTEPPVETAALAKVVESVTVQGRQAIFKTDGKIAHFEHFSLGVPPRLVVDLYGVKPVFKDRVFTADRGFKKIRVGVYPEKTRFVLDAESSSLPGHTVKSEGRAIVVGWGEEASPQTPSSAVPSADKPVTVEALDFRVEAGKSLLSVTLSGPADVIDAEAEGSVVQFGVKNALISRAVRRTIDTSAFPSAVRLITPYTVQVGKTQDVRFAVELKGPVGFSLQKETRKLTFIVEDGPFAEAAPVKVDKKEVAVPAKPVADESVTLAEAPSLPSAGPAESTLQLKPTQEEPRYSGQKISLVFDDADIRKILQLIAEVSDLNIIASDDVKGTITLRLQDVPWDQALDLIMDIKGLGMVREGNVVRILPREQIRAAEESKLTSARNKERLEDLVTEVVPVSYTNLANVSAPAKELLTERGKLTEDARNKKLIVKDIPSVVAEIRNLVGLLDTPERQVMIEARIVEADSTFTRNLGVSWGLTYNNDGGGPWDASSGAISGGGSFVISPVAGNAGLGSSITLGRLGIDSTVLDLKISALETSRQGKVISTPRVSTLNGQAATISQGTKIPYQSSGSDGLPKTEFVDANLELTVTPEINPDNSIILDIIATNSTPTQVEGADAPGISTKEAKTKLLVKDGETTVIGGIFVEDASDSESGIPFLRKIPYLGHLFKSATKSNNRSELLIFITPRIVR